MLTNIFTANIGSGANPVNIAIPPKVDKFTPAQKNNEFKTDTTQPSSTDNIYDIAQKSTPDEPKNDFSEAMTQAAAAQKTSKIQNSQNTEEKTHIYGAAVELTAEQLELTKHLIAAAAVTAKSKSNKKPLVKPRKAENSAKVPDNPKQLKDLAKAAQAKNKPSIVDSNTETTENGQTENKPSVTVDGEHPGQKNISHGNIDAAKKMEIKPGQGKDTENLHVSPEVAPKIKIAVNQQQTRQTASQEIIDTAQTSLIEAKPIMSEQQSISEKKPNTAQANNTIAQSTVDTGKAVPASEKTLKTIKPVKVDSLKSAKVPTANEDTADTENKASNRQKDFPTILEEKVPTDSKGGNNVTDSGQKQVLQRVLADSPKNPQSDSIIDNFIKDLNPQQTKVVPEVAARQAKTNTGTTTGNNSNTTNFAQVLLQSNQQQVITEPGAAGLEKAASPASVNEQIQETITASLKNDNQQITIQLDPPQLGKVTIKFQQQDGQITGELQVDKTQTRYEIERVLPQITKNLQDAGVQIKRIEVVLNNQPEQQSSREQTAYDGNAHNQNGSNYRTNQDTFTENWSPDIFNNSYFDSNSPYQMQAADGAINMLA